MSVNESRDSNPKSSPGTVYEERTVKIFGGDKQDRFRAFNPVMASFCILNETGAKTVSLINGHRTVEEIANQLARDYSVDDRTVLPAVIILLEDLKKHKLIYCKGEFGRQQAGDKRPHPRQRFL
jgi:hypothetical protein